MKIEKIFFWKGAHSFHRLTYHIVCAPKYRNRILQGKLALRLRELLFQCAETNRWFVHDVEAMPDHLHMLIQLPANVTPAKAVNFFKGGSSKVLRKEFPELQEFLWGDSFWQDGYFVESVGRLNEKAMREYLKNQRNQENL
ncbi:MAG TPA: IS200/IS605 family transposase [Candidatus Paceibacterota bacterium]|nr:IS200/IS605 family transposase [Candidatus Pacearchaeota archaeon]HOX29900.1 IS200/IS605 family transposase [Candidatus Pacearchaeota archaeon]HOX30418.1 IS200/IS605 family transposase [Candidatus Pacearchaeota archaeon]HRZ50600.1 IS200/IS605 family transposase [Candidatus Paceibacterota bacterium]HSA36503.1 IS200/IS605 family transposase [Candidatus Paceibacterota bacterium]